MMEHANQLKWNVTDRLGDPAFLQELQKAGRIVAGETDLQEFNLCARNTRTHNHPSGVEFELMDGKDYPFTRLTASSTSLSSTASEKLHAPDRASSAERLELSVADGEAVAWAPPPDLNDPEVLADLMGASDAPGQEDPEVKNGLDTPELR